MSLTSIISDILYIDILYIDNLRHRRLGIFINPVGGGGNSLNVYKNVVHPLFKAANIKCDVNGMRYDFYILCFNLILSMLTIILFFLIAK